MTSSATPVPAVAVALAPAESRARTGGPGDESNVLEHILGWTLVVVLAVLVTRLGLM
ncbi:SCO1431 family membrane protein [Streptomyces sp. NPDC051018]|uniref:SCO1431 family membrane protein n=1 Tax=Streptomyces sp. NPDC051018 TaxID=3365639 RepID=UPI0037A7CC14